VHGDSGPIVLFVYADGASRGNPGPASYGVSIVDHSGNVIAEFGEKLGIRTNNYAEYQGVIAALRYLSTTDYRQVTIRMDSKLVIEQLSGRWKVKSDDMRELVGEASRLLGPFEAKLEWIPREQNSRADQMANEALDSGDFQNVAAEIELSGIQPRSIRAPRQHKEPVTLVLVRHGHTVATEKDLISGGHGNDPALSELGLQDARAASKALTPLLEFFGLSSPSAVLHSPMVRTTQTAEAIARELGLGLIADDRLREISFGNWDGLEMTVLEAGHAQAVKLWRGSMTRKPQGGESLVELKTRVAPLLGELAENYAGKTVVLVAHMMPLRAISALSLPGADAMYWSFNFSPGGISILRFFGTEFAEQFVLNSCQHLFSD
jgi:ribonuclease H / adenosylcobalamin/alpha-ribazole phosphatase